MVVQERNLFSSQLYGGHIGSELVRTVINPKLQEFIDGVYEKVSLPDVVFIGIFWNNPGMSKAFGVNSSQWKALSVAVRSHEMVKPLQIEGAQWRTSRALGYDQDRKVAIAAVVWSANQIFPEGDDWRSLSRNSGEQVAHIAVVNLGEQHPSSGYIQKPLDVPIRGRTDHKAGNGKVEHCID